MKSAYLLIGCICLLACAVMPAQAFTAKALTISLDTNGNAQVDFQYDLSFTEQAAIFFNIANPSAELANALDNNLNRQVTVVRADNSLCRSDHPFLCYDQPVQRDRDHNDTGILVGRRPECDQTVLVGLAHLG